MNIESLQKGDEKRWDEFVLNSPKSTLHHLIGWKNIIKKSYGHQDLYLVTKEGGEMVGVLPTFLLKNFIFGKKIISLPFCSYGGIIARNKTVQDSLSNYLKSFVRENKYDFFELRSFTPSSDLVTDLSQFTFVLDLTMDENLIWQKIDKKVRNQIRKAGKFGLELKFGNQYLNNFYKLYQKNMRRLGTPVHSFSFFENVIKEFPNQTQIFLAELGNKPIVSLFLFYFKDKVSNLWAASDYRYSQMNPNDYLYWEVIKKVAKEKFKYFDFGRSEKDSGTFNFKKQWGGEIKQLYYQYYSSDGEKIIFDKKKYGKISKVWSKIPLIIANKVGPKLRKFIP